MCLLVGVESGAGAFATHTDKDEFVQQVSSTISARAPQAQPSIIGGHRYRTGDGAEFERGEGGRREWAVGGGGLGEAAESEEARRLQEFVQGGAGGSLLNISGMELTATELGAMAQVLASRPSITTIDMTDSNIGDEGVAAVANALEGKTSVTALGLSGNKISDLGASHIARLLASQGGGLVSLFLRNNAIGHDGARQLAHALRTNGRLAKLNLKNNALGPDGARELAAMLPLNSTLTELNVWDNDFGPAGTEAVAAALAMGEAVAVQDLDVGCNHVGDAGVTALAAALGCNSTLTRLSLRLRP